MIKMTNKKIPVHSFDVYGVLLDQNLMGTQIVDLFSEVATGKLSVEEISIRIGEYRALLSGLPEALKEKPRILEKIYNYALNEGAVLDHSKALYEDTLHSLAGILDRNQQVVVLGSHHFDINVLPQEISNRMIGAFFGTKSDPETFRKLACSLGDKYRLVSHSENGLIELRAAEKAGLNRNNLVYVNRNIGSIEDVLEAGYTVQQVLNSGLYVAMGEKNNDK